MTSSSAPASLETAALTEEETRMRANANAATATDAVVEGNDVLLRESVAALRSSPLILMLLPAQE